MIYAATRNINFSSTTTKIGNFFLLQTFCNEENFQVFLLIFLIQSSWARLRVDTLKIWSESCKLSYEIAAKLSRNWELGSARMRTREKNCSQNTWNINNLNFLLVLLNHFAINSQLLATKHTTWCCVYWVLKVVFGSDEDHKSDFVCRVVKVEESFLTKDILETISSSDSPNSVFRRSSKQASETTTSCRPNIKAIK